MKYNPDIHHRRSIRLQKYDYSAPGAYFITICTWEREILFGEIAENYMHLNDFGMIIDRFWHRVPARFPLIELDAFAVMLNHFHGILMVSSKAGGETPPLQNPIGRAVAYFKYLSAKEINRMRENPGLPIWQRNYYEHIIRSESELHKIRTYIMENPLKWEEDEENPNRINR